MKLYRPGLTKLQEREWVRRLTKFDCDIFTAACTNGTEKFNLTPKFIEGCDLCESYGET